MNEREMINCTHVMHNFYEAANAVYNEMYAAWKKDYFDYFGVEMPIYPVYIYKTHTLLPTAYMNGESEAKPNSLFNALKSDNIEKAKEIIRKAQYMTVSEFAKKNNMDYRLAKREIRSFWAIATAKAKCEPIPVILEKHMLNWMNSEVPHCESVARSVNKFNMKNSSLFSGIFNVYNIAAASILVSSKTEEEYEENHEKLAYYKEYFKDLRNEWYAY